MELALGNETQGEVEQKTFIFHHKSYVFDIYDFIDVFF